MVYIGGFFHGIQKKPPNQQFFIAPNCIFLRRVHKEKTAEITVFQRFS